jgi:hypothetical protein
MSPAASNRPTLGEVVVRLDGLAKQLTEVIVRFDKADETYLRRDVYEADRRGTENTVTDVRTDVSELRTDLDAIASQRRQLWLMLASSFALPIVVGIILALLFSVKSVHP